jgi:hypothetical protein
VTLYDWDDDKDWPAKEGDWRVTAALLVAFFALLWLVILWM